MSQIKQPGESLIFEFDFTPRIGAGELTGVVDALVTPAGRVAEVLALTIAATDVLGQMVRLRLNGGTDGETYLVAVRAVDAASQIHKLEADFAVVDLGFEIPTISSPYLSASAFVNRIGLDEAISLTDTTGAGRIETARLATALADAQAEVDGYLAAHYQTPLSTVPAQIATFVHDLALARLYRSEPPAGVIDRRDRARQQLRDLAKGLITLPGAAALTPAETNDTPVLISTGTRLFSRSTLAGL